MSAEPTFDEVVREHGRMIARIAASHEARPHLAEELVQEILLAVWRSLPSFRAESSLHSFIARIASNRAASHVARALRTPVVGELDDEFPAVDDSPEGAAMARDSEDRMLQAVRKLPFVSRQVVALTLEGLGPGEIAAALGISANAVSIRLLRAKEYLRNCLGEHE